jgi:anhydro-N-acetylmuramic acid kinase
MRHEMSSLPAYLTKLQDYVTKPTRTVVGLHSGTSADGPTAVVAEVTGVGDTARVTVIDHETYPYPRALRTALLQVMDRRTATVDLVCQTDMAVGEFFADAAIDLARRSGLDMADVDLVASTGQVTYQVIPGQRAEHQSALGREYMSMLDLGEGGVIASRTGVVTVSSMRRKDNAVGGFGAPLVPFGDWVNFRDAIVDRVVWNIGGICNATIIPAGKPYEAVSAFDAGPGNMVLDRLASDATDGRLTYDEDGALAASGRVSQELLDHALQDAFIQQDPPKAAARQLYGDEFAGDFAHRGRELGLSAHDLLATATALTAEVIALAQRRFVAPHSGATELVFAGGGARNPVLMRMIAERVAPTPVVTSEQFGVPIDCREVLAMVLIANQTVHGRPSNCVPATGAARPVALGHIDLPV